jgi:hypothetical protein
MTLFVFIDEDGEAHYLEPNSSEGYRDPLARHAERIVALYGDTLKRLAAAA